MGKAQSLLDHDDAAAHVNALQTQHKKSKIPMQQPNVLSLVSPDVLQYMQTFLDDACVAKLNCLSKKYNIVFSSDTIWQLRCAANGIDKFRTTEMSWREHFVLMCGTPLQVTLDVYVYKYSVTL